MIKWSFRDESLFKIWKLVNKIHHVKKGEKSYDVSNDEEKSPDKLKNCLPIHNIKKNYH